MFIHNILKNYKCMKIVVHDVLKNKKQNQRSEKV